MDDEMWEKINLQIRSRQFELSSTMPISWKSISLTLKHAADRLFDIYHVASLRIIDQVIAEHSKAKNDKKQMQGSRKLEGKELIDHQDASLISVYFLLAGYALENLIKAILLIQHPEFFKKDESLTGVQSHNLLQLCERCGLKMEEEETALLNKLSEYIIWQGKYPVPLRYDDMWPTKAPDGSWKTQGEAFKRREQQDKFDRLYQKVWNHLEAERLIDRS